MKRQTLIVALAAVVATALVSAQTVDLRIFRGFVQIRNTSSSALLVTGGGVLGHTNDPSGAVLDVRSAADGTGVGGGMRISRSGNDSYLIINADDDGASGVGFIQAGDNAAYRPLELNPLGSQALFGNGTVSLPSMGFVNEPASGFYWDNLASGGFNAAVGGVKSFRVSASGVEVPARAMGTGGVQGPAVIVGRNTSGGGAPGQLVLEARNGAGSGFLWVDTTGVLRIGTFYVTEVAGDTGGTVVGAQTSSRASKDILRRVTETALAMQTIRDTPVYEFRYKNGAFNGETFTGIVTDDSPMFGMDQGKSFNPVSAFGASVLALQDLDARVRELEARLRSLEARR